MIDCRSYGPRLGQAVSVILARRWRTKDDAVRQLDGAAFFRIGPFLPRSINARLRFVRSVVADPGLLLEWWAGCLAAGYGECWRLPLPALPGVRS